MRPPRLDRFAASTAVALVLAISSGLALADPDDPAPFENRKPVAAVGVASGAAAPAASDVEARIPLPEPAGVPPITASTLDPADLPPITASTLDPAPAVADTTPSYAPAAAASTPAAAPVDAAGIPAAAPADSASAPAAAPTEAGILAAIPVPEPADVPPPSLKDLGKNPLGSMKTADLPVAEQMRELISGRLDRVVPGRKERAAVEAFYQGRGFAPLWIDNGRPGERMKAAAARLRAADADGLEPGDYVTSDLGKLTAAEANALAEAELKLTNAVLTFARHAQSGRITPSRISPNIDFAPPAPEPADVLAKLAGAQDIGKTLDAFNPPHDGFRALKAKLAELRGRTGETEVVQIPHGKALKLQKTPMEDARVPLLRQRLHLQADAAGIAYDGRLADAVRDFQRQKGLGAHGVLDKVTIDALNGRTKSRDIDAVVSNMERWRWLPRDLGKAYVMVNVPDFTLKTVNNGATVFKTRIVVGKPATPSPSFSAQIENILVNPTWHVPESIIYGEYLPALAQDPTVLSRMGLIVGRNADGRISIRQPPSERNALGRIKFNFPNRFHVYLHDTPDKNLFNHDRRAYSHGCMRVQNPAQFGEVLASIAIPHERYSAERLTRMFGTGEQWLKFKAPIPVHLTYMNAYVDEHGKLVMREDLYGYDGRVQAALRGEYMAIAERSQRVTPGAAASARTTRTTRGRYAVPQQQPGFLPFFSLFRDRSGI
jgi:L,D-transpeptidase YcbB